jgi:hypothetical protein
MQDSGSGNVLQIWIPSISCIDAVVTACIQEQDRHFISISRDSTYKKTDLSLRDWKKDAEELNMAKTTRKKTRVKP